MTRQPNPSFINPDDFPEPHMEAVKVSEAERLAQEIDGERYGDVAAELRRLAAVERACDGWKQVSKQWRCAAEIIHGMSKEDAQSLKELRADRDRLAAEVEALRQFAEHVRAHGDTRLASMAIAVLNAAKAKESSNG